MSDITERLRACSADPMLCGDYTDVMQDAAAEIDRLRAQIDATHVAYCHSQQHFVDSSAECDRLRAQVAEMQSHADVLALLVMRMARRMRHAREGRGHRAGDDALVHAATDYLHRKRLISPLRAADEAAAIDRARKSGDGSP